MIYLSNFFLLFGNTIILAPLAICGFIFYHRNFLIPILLLLFTMILSAFLKAAFAIPYSPELVQKLGKNGFAFPSGHMQSVVVFYGWFLVSFGNKWLRIILLSIILGVGFALIYEGYHNLYDVLGAVFFGSLTIGFYKVIIFLISKKIKFSKDLMGEALILLCSICLMVAFIFLYEIPPHLMVVICIMSVIVVASFFFNCFFKGKKLSKFKIIS
jgi:membrane-associated phospholipid phosphatase